MLQRAQLKELAPVLSGMLIPVSFGMMLGWPAFAYPYLLDETVSPIPFTLDDSSLVAGFLLEGNTVGALLSPANYLPWWLALSVCFCLQTGGWIVMYFARDKFWFLGSRLSVGIANAYGVCRLNDYVKDAFGENALVKYMPLCTNVGIVLVYVLGAFVEFRTVALCGAGLSALGLAAFSVASQLKACCACTRELKPDHRANVIAALQDKDCLKATLILFVLVFVQQYGGGPSHIVYPRIIFSQTGNEYASACTIAYAVTFAVSTYISLRFEDKLNLPLATLLCILCLTLQGLYFAFKDEILQHNRAFAWVPVILLFIYNFVHTQSYAALPWILINRRVQEQYAPYIWIFWTVHASMSAVFSTKIFQVLFERYGMEIGYGFFVAVLTAGLAASFFIPDLSAEKKSETKEIKEQCRVNIAFVSSNAEIAKI